MSNSGANQEESNTSFQSIVPLPSAHSRAKNIPITNLSSMQFQINKMGNMRTYNFYIPDVTGDSTGLAFCVPYDKARPASTDYGINSKDLCCYVGSMLCSVVPGFRSSVEAALNRIGIKLRFVSLPSQADENKIAISCVPKLDWSSILVVFGYCILLLFKVDSEIFLVDKSKSPHTKRIPELQAKIGCVATNFLHIPFNPHKEDDIRSGLGTHALRASVIAFLKNNFNHSDHQICSLCQYLTYVISRSDDMFVFTAIHERLVKTQSPVLSDSRVVEEVDNLEELIKAIATHGCPQYFNHFCSVSELFCFDVSRFRTLLAVAMELEIGSNGSESLRYFSEKILSVDFTTVQELLKLHRTAMAQNRNSKRRRCMPIVSGI